MNEFTLSGYLTSVTGRIFTYGNKITQWLS